MLCCITLLSALRSDRCLLVVQVNQNVCLILTFKRKQTAATEVTGQFYVIHSFIQFSFFCVI